MRKFLIAIAVLMVSLVSLSQPEFISESVRKNAGTIKVFLQGAYSTSLGRHKNVTTTWRNVLQNNALSQPYNLPAFNYYDGGFPVKAPIFTSTPGGSGSDILDWVLLELRDATNPSIVITGGREAAFILCDGTIVDVNKNPVSFSCVPEGNYHLVIRHRNHLAVQTATTITLDNLNSMVASYDFTKPGKAYDNRALDNRPMKEVAPGVFAMWGGNSNGYSTYGSPTVKVNDTPSLNDYVSLITTLDGDVKKILRNVYHPADMNMDGTVRASSGGAINDYLFLVNTVLGGHKARILTQHE